ncbi:uncharacterized protein MKK02DRAFT_29992 [Dioszegia hungarica]|uniref:Uncharacterized protein n=1 Tax=Dioszegia hungarica TaxID=4972 RepID=A0AA38H3D4_9TREE|nr:uncharacterized protein MKK02DRAFT_29992 [Dioszegia hungarica]KAI9633006.1 hypothetical protein MKK02DRAFT_29992 [Dioszegia hungarica]
MPLVDNKLFYDPLPERGFHHKILKVTAPLLLGHRPAIHSSLIQILTTIATVVYLFYPINRNKVAAPAGSESTAPLRASWPSLQLVQTCIVLLTLFLVLIMALILYAAKGPIQRDFVARAKLFAVLFFCIAFLDVAQYVLHHLTGPHLIYIDRVALTYALLPPSPSGNYTPLDWTVVIATNVLLPLSSFTLSIAWFCGRSQPVETIDEETFDDRTCLAPVLLYNYHSSGTSPPIRSFARGPTSPHDNEAPQPNGTAPPSDPVSLNRSPRRLRLLVEQQRAQAAPRT